ncbi:MAG: lipid-A-disaccharide synthase [Verrucomicrobia bacterium]|nr:lipid-A-disaccharide synthase [Verrucomicrobiota bacterium]
MKCDSVMFIAGEASGDALAAQLVAELRNGFAQSAVPQAPKFFGAGGSKMVEAGVTLAIDMTSHAVIGLADVLRNYGKFRRIFNDLLKLAVEKKPELIVLVDFSGFNRRFAHAIRACIRDNQADCKNWTPKIVQFVSPQVWASRPSRAEKMAQDIDLLLCIFPFEKDWYAKRVPDLRVEFVGHPIFDRYASHNFSTATGAPTDSAKILLLPGSRRGELKRHLPVMLEAAAIIQNEQTTAQFEMVLPTEELKIYAQQICSIPADVHVQIGNLTQALPQATLALASTGTVLIECAYFGVPTIAMYKTSWSTYQIGKRIVQVKYLSMPNILAGKEVYPEFVQDNATPSNIANAALDLLRNPARRQSMQTDLAQIVSTLGTIGASRRAAEAILNLDG